MSNILNINDLPTIDNSISSLQYHSYNPYTTSFNNNDEIHIVIQQQDLYVLPCESEILIEGVIVRDGVPGNDDAANVMPHRINNWAAFLFNDITYNLNGVEIDRCKNVGITSTMKGFITHQESDKKRLEIASWKIESNIPSVINGRFSVCIPLKHIFGFAEDFSRIIICSKNELVLTRNRNDTNAFRGQNNIAQVNIQKIQWRIQHIQVSDEEKLNLLRYVDRKVSIPLNFRKWEVIENPTLQQSDRNIWSVKTSTSVNKPRYIILGFQTAKNNIITADMSRFDHCDVRDIKIYLNSECYPYEPLSADFENDQYIVVYNMYTKFYESYFYGEKKNSFPLLSYSEFKTIAPLFVFDCSRQNESLKTAIVDIKIEMQTRNNIPENTSAYCLIIHDCLFTYNPYTNIVNKMI